MTDLPPAPPTPPPVLAPTTPAPSPGGAPVSPEEPASRPSWKQAAIIFVATVLVAAGSCAGFLSNMQHDAAGLFMIGFILAIPVAAFAFALLVFRLAKPEVRDGWPSPAQCVVIAVAGAVLGAAGCAGWAVTFESLVPVAIVLLVGFAAGTLLALGGMLLLFWRGVRAIVSHKAPS